MIPKFKFHNILVNGQETIPGKEFYNQSPSCERITHFFCFRYPYNDRNKIRIVDLGPLEGGHAAELIRYGFDVTCIEGRAENCAKLQWLKEQLPKGSAMTIIHDDVWNIEKYGKFDVVLCAGLLYHLDRPVEFIKLITGCAKEAVILSTHYSEKEDFRYDLIKDSFRIIRKAYKLFPFLFRRRYFALSKLQMNEGYPGRWFEEFKPTTDPRKIKNLLASALTNHRSFWLTKWSLRDLITKNGFRIDDFSDDNKNAIILYISTKIKR